MADTDDITSTEKLLDVIRGKNSDSFPVEEKPINSFSQKPKTSPKGVSLPKIFSAKKIYTIGVDIGHEFIRLSRTIKASDGSPILVDYKVVGYDKKTVKGSPEFSSILKSSLLSFCGNTDNCNIWTLMSAADVNVHRIKIPKVAKKQLENAIYWTAKKENAFDEKDQVFDFELQGEIVDQGIPKYAAMVYTAPRAEIERVKSLFDHIEVTLTGITVAPFAIQNIIRKKWLSPNENTVASLFIGNDYSRIDIYHKENLVMTRGIKTGITSMMESIAETLSETSDIKLKKDEARKILFSISPDSDKLQETDAGFGIKVEEIYEMTLPVLERLARQVERTLEHYSSSLNQEKVEKIYVSSAMNIYDPVIQYISEQLGIKCVIFDPFEQQASSQILAALSPSERMSLVPVLGLSFSDNSYTPNAIFTYQQKKSEVSVKKLNRGISITFAIVLMICLTTVVYQGLEVSLFNKKLLKLEKEISKYDPLLTTEKIEKMAAEVIATRQITQKYAERYLGVAIINEISDLTPVNIKLINLKIYLANPAKDKSEKSPKDNNYSVAIEGLVSGDRNILDSLLAQYVMKLGNSPVLHQVTVDKNTVVTFKKSEVLQFSLSAKIGK